MKFAVTFLTAASAVPQQPSFEEWAATYGINGNDLEATYKANVEEIDRLNALNTTAEFGVNEFSGMSSEDFAAMYRNYPEHEDVDDSVFTRLEYSGTVAKSIDWVAKGGVTKVKNQHGCGSCWAHSVIATMESRHKILTGEEVDLSEQHLIDCGGDAHSKKGGCHGGYTSRAFYWLGNHTVCTESSYPYKHKDESCKKSCTSSHLRVSKLIQVDKTEKALEQALNDAPVSNLVDSGMLQHYHKGVLQGKTTCHHDHAILVVGYASNYWKIKNSWGSGWGEHGFVRVERGGGTCGKFGMLSSNPKSIKLESDTRRRRSDSRRRNSDADSEDLVV